MNSIAISLDDLTDQLWSLWRLWTEQAHAPGGLSPEQYWILRTLTRSPGLSVSQLASLRGVTPAAITAATRRMEAQGWLRRERPEDNQRVVRLSSTPAGTALLNRVREERRAWLVRLLAALSPEEQRAAARLAAKVLHHLGTEAFRKTESGREAP